MPLQPFEATKKLCERSGWTITNLELQKHLFLAQLAYMKDQPGRLIGVEFEAWDFGPVVPEIYRSVKRFGADSIENIFRSINVYPKLLDNYIYKTYDLYKNKTPGQLVALTHRPRGAWDRNYKPGILHVPIPDADIRAEALLFG